MPTKKKRSLGALRAKITVENFEDQFGGSTKAKCLMLGQRSKRGPKQGCPVQMLFVDGKPHLRFCIAEKQDGFLAPITDGEHARRVASCVCAEWQKHRGKPIKQPGDKSAAKRYKAAFQRALQTCRAAHTLGGKRKRKR